MIIYETIDLSGPMSHSNDDHYVLELTNKEANKMTAE